MLSLDTPVGNLTSFFSGMKTNTPAYRHIHNGAGPGGAKFNAGKCATPDESGTTTPVTNGKAVKKKTKANPRTKDKYLENSYNMLMDLRKAYEGVYTARRGIVCVAGMGEGLYEMLKVEIHKCVNRLAEELEKTNKEGVEWIGQSVEMCAWFEGQVVIDSWIHVKALLESLLTYLNCAYVLKNPNLPSIQTSATPHSLASESAYLAVISSWTPSTLFAVKMTFTEFVMSSATSSVARSTSDKLLQAAPSSAPIHLGSASTSSLLSPEVPYISKHEASYTKILSHIFGERLEVSNSPALVLKQGAIATSPEFALGRIRGQVDQRNELIRSVQKLLEVEEVSPELHKLCSQWVLVKDDDTKSRSVGKELITALKSSKFSSPIIDRILALRAYFPTRLRWIIGSDAWSYDLDASGLHHASTTPSHPVSTSTFSSSTPFPTHPATPLIHTAISNLWQARVLNAAALRGEKPFSKLRYLVFTLEDAHYYNKPGKDLDTRLEQLGRERFADIGLADDQDADGPDTGYKVWEPLVWKMFGVNNIEVK
ncbi:hypothetical protein F4604DRAFT_1986708 [Suillus subluteus]|nr:hypothetical protein F4604DRAFT_1986708 [Suillus subluteus]